MRLKNNVLKGLNSDHVIAFVLAAITSFLLFAIYTSNVQYQSFSLVDMFGWFVESISSLLIYSDLQAKIFIILFAICLPIGVYLVSVAYIIKYCLAVKKITGAIHIKSVDLLSDKICFNYNKSSNNIACQFSDIKFLDMEVSVARLNVYSGGMLYGGGYYANGITFMFVKNDNSELSIYVTPFPLYITSFIFSVIDYCKQNNIELSYRFVHADGKTSSTTEELQKQVDNYEKYGRPRLTENEKWFVVMFSSLFYLLGLGLIITFRNNVANFPEDFGLIIFLLPLLVSGVMDIFYIADKKQFKDAKTNNLLSKYYELFLLIKILLVLVVIFTCLGF